MFFVIVCVLDIRAIKIFPDFVRGGVMSSLYSRALYNKNDTYVGGVALV
jgi:hypothetical protein